MKLGLSGPLECLACLLRQRWRLCGLALRSMIVLARALRRSALRSDPDVHTALSVWHEQDNWATGGKNCKCWKNRTPSLANSRVARLAGGAKHRMPASHAEAWGSFDDPQTAATCPPTSGSHFERPPRTKTLGPFPCRPGEGISGTPFTPPPTFNGANHGRPKMFS